MAELSGYLTFCGHGTALNMKRQNVTFGHGLGPSAVLRVINTTNRPAECLHQPFATRVGGL